MLYSPVSLTLLKDLITNATHQPENVLIVQPYQGEKDDRVLFDLIPFLKDQCSLDDVSGVNVRYIAYLNSLKASDEKETQLKQKIEKPAPFEKGIRKGSAETAEKISISRESTKETDITEEKTEEVPTS